MIGDFSISYVVNAEKGAKFIYKLGWYQMIKRHENLSPQYISRSQPPFPTRALIRKLEKIDRLIDIVLFWSRNSTNTNQEEFSLKMQLVQKKMRFNL